MSDRDARDAGGTPVPREDTPEIRQDLAVPNTVQIMAWRGLLDAFGQLSAAWSTAGQAQQAADPGTGPGTPEMPDELVSAFTSVCRDTADVLTGIAAVLSRQKTDPEPFAEVLASQRAARGSWERAQEALKAAQGAR